MADSQQTSTALASLLESRLMDWERARKPQELKLLECYRDVMRIPTDEDTNGTGTAKTRKAKGLFIGSTRNKVRAARAKIIDALFGSGNMPFDTTPTDEKLAPYADVMEDIITEQMIRGKFKDIMKTGVNTLATYGTGFVFGPFVRKETLTETSAQPVGGSTVLQESKYEFDMPYFELGNTLDVYPDPEAREIEKGLGAFWVTMESPHTVAAWKDLDGYSNVDQALNGGGDRGNETGSERASQLRGNVEYWYKNERIKVARFFGKVPKSSLSKEAEAAAEPSETQAAKSEMVDAIIIMAGGVVVKVDENPYGGKNPTHRCLYEAVEHEIWGVGVAENNAPHQKVTNAAFRLFMEGKGMALLGTSSVDRSKFLATEDFRKFPGKVYQMKPGLSPEERKDAIVQHVEADITNGWIEVIKMSEQFSDDDTGITKYTQGDDSRNLNKTASGISMIMSASSLPMKEVIQNIDAMWIEPIVECYVDWNLKYLEPETVQKIHGDKEAELWAQIKQFGKSSFMDWQATGTSSFMQKEVLTNKIRAFAEFALGNPVTASLIDAKELLQQTWDVMEIGKESPVKDDGPDQLSPEMHQKMQQVSDHVDQLNQQLQQSQQAIKEAQDAAQQEHAARIKAEIDAKEAQSMLTVERAEAAALKTIQGAQGDGGTPFDENSMEWQKALLDAKTTVEVARISSVAKTSDSATAEATTGLAEDFAEPGAEGQTAEPAQPAEPAAPSGLEQAVTAIMTAAQQMSAVAEQMSKPKTTVLHRDANGKLTHSTQE